MQKRKGFTTVELVIVIAVIAILAVALVPTFAGLIKSANLSADQQTANSLTTLTTMYALDRRITSPETLKKVINEGMSDENYYDNLKPKSADDGYYFWYDYETYRVHVGNIDDIAKIIEEKKAEPTGGMSIPNWGITMAGTEGGTSSSFEPTIRTDLLEGFYLMGTGSGNTPLDLITKLDCAGSMQAYTDALVEIMQYDTSDANTTDSALMKKIIGKLKEKAAKTIIMSGSDAYNPADVAKSNPDVPNLKPDDIDISPSVVVGEKLNGTLTEQLSNVVITLPSFNGQSSILGSGVLENLDNTCTIYVDVPGDKLHEVIKLGATNAQIVANDGTIYTQSTKEESGDRINVFTPVAGGSAIENKVSAEDLANMLASYLLSVSGNNYVYVDQATKTIYYSTDVRKLTDSAFKIVAEQFRAANGNNASYGAFKWKITRLNETGEKITEDLSSTVKSVSIEPGVDEITAITLGVKCTYKVKEVKVDKIEISEIGSLKPSRNIAYDDTRYSWTLTPQITLNYPEVDGKITLDKTISIFSDSKGIFTLDPKTNTISISSTQKGDYSNKVIFSCSGKQSIEYTLNLIDTRNAAFGIKDTANTQTKYGFNYVVGTQGHTLTLGDLFTPNSGAVISGDIVLSKDGVTAWGDPIPAASWSTTPVDLSAAVDGKLTLYIKVAEGQYGLPLTLDVKSGAYNVTSAAEWAAYKTKELKNTDIAILNSFTIDGQNSKSSATADTASSALKYAVDVGSGDVHGNYHVINVINFYVKYTYGSNYIIKATAGSVVDRVIIIGPDYGDTVVIDNSGAESKGTFVAAVMATGGTAAAPVTITNSFLSGFRSPLWANTGKTVVKNTTLHLGNYANVYVDAKSTLELDSVTTVQYETTNKSLGGGISYKHNCGTTQVLTATNLKQYNYLTQSQITTIVKAAGGTAAAVAQIAGLSLDVSSTDLKSIDSVKHTFDGVDFYHMGITALSMPILADYNLSSNTPANLGDKLDITYGANTACSNKMAVTKQYGWFSKKDGIILSIWGLPSTATGTRPVENIQAHISEFFTDRGVAADSISSFLNTHKTVLDSAS